MDQQTPATPQESVAPGTATTQEFVFGFRTDKIRDNEGNVIGTGRKHPDVKAPIPIPTYADLAAFLAAGGKEAQLILEAAIGMVENAARQQINDFRETQGLTVDFTPTNFALDKLSLTAIANTPRSERGGPAISDEDWTGFLEDYSHTMTQIVGYEPKRVALHVAHFKAKLARVKNDKASVGKLLDLLNNWASKTENLEDHLACFQDLEKRANRYLQAEDKNVAEAL